MKKENIYSHIAMGIVTGILNSVIAFFIGILLLPFILRQLGAAGYGNWVFFVSLASYVYLFEMGLTTGLVKIWAEHETAHSTDEIAASFRTVFFLFVIAGMVFLAAAGFTAKLYPHIFGSLIFFAIGSVLMLWGEPMIAIMRGFQRTSLVNLINTATFVLNAVGVWWFLTKHFGIQGIAYALILSNLFRFLSLVFLVRRLIPNFFVLLKGPFGSIKNVWGLAAVDQITRIWTVAVSPTNRIILFGILGGAILTSYDLGSRLVTCAGMIPGMMLPTLMPAFSYFMVKNGRGGVRDFLFRTNKYLILISLPFYWFILLFARPLTRAWLGQPAPEVAYAAQILLIGVFINLLTGPSTQALIGIGKPKLCVQKVFIGCLLGITLPLIFGVIGKLRGFLIGESLANVIPALVFFRKLERETPYGTLRGIVSLFLRASIILLFLLTAIFFIYTANPTLLIWHQFWVWTIMLTLFLITAILAYRIFGLVTTDEIKKMRLALRNRN